MGLAHEMFGKRRAAFLEQLPAAQHADYEAAFEAILAKASEMTDRAQIGATLRPLLNELDRSFRPTEPKPDRDGQLLALRSALVLDDVRLAELRALLGEPGVGKAIDGAYGQLAKVSTHPESVVLAYTMIEGFMFERSRRTVARTLGYTERAPGRKVRVSFTAVREGEATRTVALTRGTSWTFRPFVATSSDSLKNVERHLTRSLSFSRVAQLLRARSAGRGLEN